jgi:dihydrofolate synthase/folylpolyglutamate synthase
MDAETAYNKALDYLYSFVDYSLKKSSELAKANFNLERMRELMILLGNPEQKFSILHIAGTKGKGTNCLCTDRSRIQNRAVHLAALARLC